MRKLIIFFLTLLYVVGVFHHPIISLTHAENSIFSHHHGENAVEHSHISEKNFKHTDHDIDEEDQALSRKSQIQKTQQLLSIGVTSSIFDFGNDYFLLDNKNLVRKTSPPTLYRKIKNYNYSELTQIVISHT